MQVKIHTEQAMPCTNANKVLKTVSNNLRVNLMQRVCQTSRVWILKDLTRFRMTKPRCIPKTHSLTLICLPLHPTCSSKYPLNTKATRNPIMLQALKHHQQQRQSIVHPGVLNNNMTCNSSNRHMNSTTTSITNTTISSSSSSLSTKDNNPLEVNNNEVSLLIKCKSNL